MALDVSLPVSCQMLFNKSRYKVLYGGRGGGKSVSAARALLVLAMQKKLRVLCTREFQVSIRDSVHKLLGDQIAELGLDFFYEVQQNTIKGKNGSEFIFSGLKSNITKIKSMEGIDVAWCEEAETISDHSWQVLIPTIRKEGSEIWVTFNPDKDTDPTYKRFVLDPPPDAQVLKINWQDNPWFPDELKKEKDYLYRVDPQAADHIWGGETCTYTNAQILYDKLSIESFEVDETFLGPYYGADWGFAVDPTVLIRCWIKENEDSEKTLYVDHEVYGVGVEINDTPSLFERVPESKNYTIRADSARPELISYMKNNGYPMIQSVDKWPGSVEDGISHLRSYLKIIVHPRCINAIQEFKLYSYKVDKLTGDIMPIILDKHNHCLDSLRYSLQPVIRNKKIEYAYTTSQKNNLKNNLLHASRNVKVSFRGRSNGIL